MNCIECFLTDGLHRSADFVVNDHSVCQKHVQATIRERGKSPLTYTWHNDWENPALMSTEGEVVAS